MLVSIGTPYSVFDDFVLEVSKQKTDIHFQDRGFRPDRMMKDYLIQYGILRMDFVNPDWNFKPRVTG